VVSPFGARGGNGGIQDADNLCWKLALVLQGAAPGLTTWALSPTNTTRPCTKRASRAQRKA
jgi:2-polyprenyl-6-methoxyphenol hydroxylase-like FAD-dependent oxidoreductase